MSPAPFLLQGYQIPALLIDPDIPAPTTSTIAVPPSITNSAPVIKDESSLARNVQIPPISWISANRFKGISMDISFTNPKDYDIIINCITYAGSNIAISNVSIIMGNTTLVNPYNNILKKKETLILNVELNKTELNDSYNFIHVWTSEGKIPISGKFTAI